jgi:tetratricopeptide (TPR) repeat protein
VELDPFHPRANAMLTLTLLYSGRLAEARECLVFAERVFPDDPDFQVMRALLFALEDKMPAAKEQLDRAAAHLNPRQAADARNAVSLLNLLRQAEGLLSMDPNANVAWFLAKAMPAAMRMLAALPADLAEEAAPTASALFVPVPPTVLIAYRGLPAAASSFIGLKKDTGRAIKELSAAVQIHPEGTTYLLLGELLGIEDRWEEAEAAFLKAAETPSIVPVRRGALYMAAFVQAIRGHIYDRSPDPELLGRALQTTRELLALGEVRPDQAMLLVQIAYHRGEYDLARSVLAQWERKAPRDLDARRWRAKVELAAGAYGRAIEAADRVLAARPKDPVALQFRADAQARIRDQARLLPPPEKDRPE